MFKTLLLYNIPLLKHELEIARYYSNATFDRRIQSGEIFDVADLIYYGIDWGFGPQSARYWDDLWRHYDRVRIRWLPDV